MQCLRHSLAPPELLHCFLRFPFITHVILATSQHMPLSQVLSIPFGHILMSDEHLQSTYLGMLLLK